MRLSGEQLTVSLGDRDGVTSSDLLRGTGTCGNFPSGEGYIAAAEGKRVFDGEVAGFGAGVGSLTIRVESSYVTAENGDHADDFLNETEGDPGHNVSMNLDSG